MRIGTKIIFTWLILFSIFLLANLLIQEKIIMPGFIRLERETAIKDIQRSVAALNSEINHLDNLNYDWAAWDDSYEFINDHNKEYIKSNLVNSSFTDNHLNLIFHVDRKGEVVWGRSFDLVTEEDIEISEFPLTVFPGNHPLLGLDDVSSFHAGIIITSIGPVLVSARPIITSELEGPPRGTIIMGRLLDAEYISRISKQTENKLNIWQIGSPSFPEKHKEILPSLTNEKNLQLLGY